LPEDAVVGLSVGWFRPEKNLPLLLEAASRLRPRHPRLHWLLVGDGPCRQEIEDQRERLGLVDRVRLTGPLEDLRAITGAADFFALTSDWEGLPAALLESLGAGLPAVTTDVGDCRELVQEAGVGCVVPTKDPEALSEGVSTLLGGLAKLKQRAREGRRTVRERFGVPGMLRAMEEVYHEVCTE
jgi:glycosyltransferase involved in cell wall biosynthesis